jgi:malate dehydrogenase (oxaloacetate-decarboxylating)(NADP+)
VGVDDPDLLAALPDLTAELPARITVVGEPEAPEDLPVFAKRLLELRRRKGLTPPAAARLVRDPLGHALMALRTGRADGVVCGAGVDPRDTLRTILRIIGTGGAGNRAAGLSLVSGGGPLLLAADTLLHVEPDPEQLVEIALLAVERAPSLGVDPRVALLSVSDYGSLPGPASRQVRLAAEMLKTRRPDLETDGEMLPSTALDPLRRDELHTHSRIRGNARVLVFPDLQSARLSTQLLGLAGDAEVSPAFLAGLEMPVNMLPVHPTPDDLAFLVAMTLLAVK